MDIEHVEREHCFQSEVDGRRAYLYYDVDHGAMNIQSTFVPPELRGRGLARELVEAAIEYGKERNWRLEADCWYARKVLDESGQGG